MAVYSPDLMATTNNVDSVKRQEKIAASGLEVRLFYETLLAEKACTYACTTFTKSEMLELEENSSSARGERFQVRQNVLENIAEETFSTESILQRFLKCEAKGNLSGVEDYADKGKRNVLTFFTIVVIGMNIDISDQYGWTTLMCASFTGHLNVIKYLLSLGADVGKKSKSGETAADFSSKCGHYELYHYIVSKDHKKLKLQFFCYSCICMIRILLSYNIFRNSSLQNNGTLENDVKATRFCIACNCNYTSDAHANSVGHLLETQKPVLQAGYGIPVWNKGLGRNSKCRRYPLKAAPKKNKFGLGYNSDASKSHVKYVL
ncbi:unnamed protein product [Thelazia callipaeda]|uniref:ANK_REP_REGION domain-containing protein n=1 Tax=Thelazia callipaeda TaxID=103827 RepID=A0A0N5D9L6_THECL|nr:unnamed protein product [Thelazia callipaeda]